MPNQERNVRREPLDHDDRPVERYGQGQSGYGAGRYEGDRSFRSRNQQSMIDEPSHERGSDERFAGGRGGQAWRPNDRDEPRVEHAGNYGHPGHWTDETGYDEGHGQQPRFSGRGTQGPYSGYNEGNSPRGGQQSRYGSQGYQGYGQQHLQQHSNRMIGEPRYGHAAQHGYGQGFGQQGIGGLGAQGIGNGFREDVSHSGYGHQPEHDMGFRGGQQGYSPQGYGSQGYGPQGYGPQGYGSQGNRFGGPQGHVPQGMQGVHRGKGPAGYTRSDDRIREMVCDVLTDHDHIDASTIEVSVQNGEVTLQGTVEDRRTKRMAEDVIENLSGVKEVVNQLRVTDRMAGSSSQSKGGPAVEMSGREQELQTSNGGDKRHRA